MTPEARRRALGLVLVLLAAGSAWLAQRLAPPAPEAAPVAAGLGREPDYLIAPLTATVMDEQGRPRYVLQAVRLTHYPGEGAELEHPYLIQYGEGAAPVHTRARQGFLPDHRRWIRFLGEVVSVRASDPSQAGGEVRADELLIELEK